MEKQLWMLWVFIDHSIYAKAPLVEFWRDICCHQAMLICWKVHDHFSWITSQIKSSPPSWVHSCNIHQAKHTSDVNIDGRRKKTNKKKQSAQHILSP